MSNRVFLFFSCVMLVAGWGLSGCGPKDSTAKTVAPARASGDS